MAALDDLISQIPDESLRDRIRAEMKRANHQKKFGLVFEEHLPEATPLYNIPVKRGSVVAKKDGQVTDIYYVEKIEDGQATCFHKASKERVVLPVDALVCVAQFGEPIYPYLQPLDTVCNAPDSDLWHTLIEADNYHALQLLEYLYAGKVDCIYIDPPYNTGARDWKYNNDYVDGNDTYRHSKWLSMMEKRLKLAKRLLNPADSVLIVTIDEKEYLHLGCLLEEMFSDAKIQMVSCCINPGGVARASEFCRTDEYIYFVKIGSASPTPLRLGNEWMGSVKNTSKTKAHWDSLMRTGTNNMRSDRPNLFYPVFVSEAGKRFIGAGEPIPIDADRNQVVVPEGARAIWPIHLDGSEGCWQIGRETLLDLQERHFLKLGGFTDRGMAISYMKSGQQEKVLKGEYQILGYKEDNSYLLDDSDYAPAFIPGTQWLIPLHDASRHGSGILRKIFDDKVFAFPKSLYTEHDTIRFFVANKPNALIVDFFAGSGTTLHAVNLLNAEDGGHRRCIMVTNNEVSVDEAKSLTAKGYQPGDEEWSKLGIARYVTWPRTVCSIEGHDVNGKPLKGDYITSGEEPMHMADGFKANAAFFKLGFLDKNAVALGRQFKELLPVLWLKAGAHGPCPALEETAEVPAMLVLPVNHFAVLTDESQYEAFAARVNGEDSITTVYIVTDSEPGYREMVSGLHAEDTYQLYRDYLDNFRINHGGR